MELIVTAEEVARRLGLQQPLDEETRWQIEKAIGDGQADLEAYLGRAVIPRQYTEQHLIRYPGGYNLIHEPLIAVISETPEHDLDGHDTGRWTVTYTAGLDGAHDPELEPLRRFVRAAAMYSPQLQAVLRKQHPDDTRIPVSVSVEGQSVTWEDTFSPSEAEPGSGAPGALPILKSCDRWRRRSVYQRALPPRRKWSW